MNGFGEPPAYTTPVVFLTGVLTMIGGLAHALLSVPEMSAALVLGSLSVALSFLVFLYGLMLVIRYIEARDALGDTRPRTPQYDRHERTTYLSGLVITLLITGVAAQWSHASETGTWHLLPAFITMSAALLFLRLWLSAHPTHQKDAGPASP